MDRIVVHSALIAVSWLIAGCSLFSTPETEIPAPRSLTDEYSVAEARSLIQGGALLLDVRTPEEFALGHLQGAVNVPHTQIRSRIAALSPDKSRPVVLYCKSGRRAEVAREDLVELGYGRAVNGGSMTGLK